MSICGRAVNVNTTRIIHPVTLSTHTIYRFHALKSQFIHFQMDTAWAQNTSFIDLT